MSRLFFRRAFALILCTLVAIPIWVSAAPQDGALPSAESLKHFLLDSFPAFNGAENFFKGLSATTALANEYAPIIQNDPSLSEAAKLGRNFKTLYLKNLDEDFGTSNSPFFLAPERTLLRWTGQLPTSEANRIPRETPETKAAQNAWRDTLVRFGLPPHLSSSDIEAHRYDTPTYVQAFEFYRNRYAIYLQQEEQLLVHKKTPADAAKRILYDHLLEMRVANFHKTFSNPAFAKNIRFRRYGDKYTSVPRSKLALATIVFEKSVSTFAPDTVDKTGSISSGFKNHFFKKFSKDGGVKLRLETLATAKPLNPKYMVRISVPDTGNFMISEGDYSELLKKIDPSALKPGRSDYGSQLYLAEASQRDALIADTMNFLDEYDDPSLEELQVRISSRMKIFNYGFSCQPCSLTQEARLENSTTRDTLISDLRWFGYGIHPDYWQARDGAAGAKELPNFGETPPVPAKATMANAAVKENTPIWRGATESHFKKVKRAVQKALILGTLASFSIGAGAPFLAHNYADQISDTFQDVGKVVAHLMNGNGGPPQSVDTSDPLHAHNNSIDSIKDAETSASYTITNVTDEDDVPTYFNLPTAQYMAQNESRFQTTTLTGGLGDFTVEAYLPHQAHNGYVPIVEPSGFKIVGIRLHPAYSNENLTPGIDYTIQTDTHTGLIRAKLNISQSYGGYTYTAQYQKIDDLSSDDPAFQNLDKGALQRATEMIRAAGGTQLADQLTRLIQSKPNISIHDVEGAFQTTGVYTYSHEKNVGRHNQTVFDTYSRFLRHGVYWYQCTGSNLLLNDFMNHYLTETGRAFEVIPVEGFVHQTGANVMNAVGHLHNVVTNANKTDTFTDLDGTPFTMDAHYAGHHPLQSLLRPDDQKDKTKKDDHSRYDDKPGNPNEYAVMPKKIEEVVDDEGPQGAPVTSSADEIKRQNEELQRNLDLVSQRRQDVLKALESASTSYKVLANPSEAARLPGIRLLTVSKIVSDYAKKQISLENAIYYLVCVSYAFSPFSPMTPQQKFLVDLKFQNLNTDTHDPNQILANQLKEEQNFLGVSIEKGEKVAGENPAAPSLLKYLEDDALRRSLVNLVSVISNTNWRPPPPPPPEPEGDYCEIELQKI